eukprot:722851_1
MGRSPQRMTLHALRNPFINYLCNILFAPTVRYTSRVPQSERIGYIHTFGAENVIIITNGKQEWVQRSLDILNKMTNFKIPFIGSVMKVLSHYKLYIVSAQELYCNQYPKDNHLWKMMAFRQLLFDRFVYRFPCSS